MVLREHSELVLGGRLQPYHGGICYAAGEDLHSPPLAVQALSIPHVVLNVESIMTFNIQIIISVKSFIIIKSVRREKNFKRLLFTRHPREVDRIKRR